MIGQNDVAYGQPGAYTGVNKTPQATGSDTELNTGGFLFASDLAC